MDKLYCISHEEMVAIAHPSVCNGHTMEVVITEDTGAQHAEIDCCEFPLGFAYSEPPESLFSYTDNMDVSEWHQWCFDNKPGDDELIVMDLNALELKMELEAVL